MDDFLELIEQSNDPSDLMREAATRGGGLRQLSPHLFSSLFSSYVVSHSTPWYARAVESAFQLLDDQNLDLGPTTTGWLFETAFHANLALCETDDFHPNFTQLDKTLLRFERQYQNRSSQYVRGLIAYAQEDLQAAERAFTTLPGLGDGGLLSHHAGYTGFRAPSFRKTLRDYDPDIDLTFIKDADSLTNRSVVILCSADELYFLAFADDFLRQILDVSKSAHVHFHLVNAADPVRLVPQDLLRHERVSISTENTDAIDPGKHTTLARYIVLPRLMERWRKRILVTDIDMAVRSDPAQLPNESVLLAFRDGPMGKYLPTQAILAHQNLFSPDPMGLEFASLLSRYLHFMYASDKGLWGVDQVALLMVWRMLRNIGSIGNLREHKHYRYGSFADRPSRKQEAKERMRELARHE